MDQSVGRSAGGPSLVFRGRIEESDFVTLQRCVWRVALRRSIRWMAGGVLTFLAVASVVGLGVGWFLGARLPIAGWLSGAFMILLWVYALFIDPWARDRRSRRWYRGHESEFRDTKVSFGEKRIVIESDRLNADYDWTFVKRVAEAPEGFLFLNIGNALLIWLPDRLFADADARSRLVALAEASGVPVRRLV